MSCSFQVVHTQAKVVAEDVLYKYISKNVLFLATVTPKAIGDIGSVIPEDSWLFVYLVDTITGRVLHRMSHHGCQGPVHAVCFPWPKPCSTNSFFIWENNSYLMFLSTNKLPSIVTRLSLWRSLVKIGLSITTSTYVHTDMKCLLLRSTINLARYILLPDFFFSFVLCGSCLPYLNFCNILGQQRCPEACSWKA